MTNFNQNNINSNNLQFEDNGLNYQTYVNSQELHQQVLQQQLIHANHQVGIPNQPIGVSGETTPQTLPLNIKIRNMWSLISAVLLFIAMVSSEFVHCVDWGDGSKRISLSDLCSLISRSTKGWESNYKIFVIFAGCMFYLTIATFIISVLGGFVEVTIYKKISGVLSALCIIVLTFVIFSKEIYISDETTLGTGYYVLVVVLWLRLLVYIRINH